MKITKYIHSCLLIEDQGKTILLDPGSYSYEQKILDINTLPKLDVIGITHEHMDHMDIGWIKQIVSKFPKVQIFGTDSIKNILQKENITVLTQENDFISLKAVPHEKIFMGPAPENVMITIFGKFATPGDSLTFDSSPEVLALPIQAPWGSTTWAVEQAVKVKPSVIVPIHDWHWKEEVRIGLYERLEKYFEPLGIRFLKAETGVSFKIS